MFLGMAHKLPPQRETSPATRITTNKSRGLTSQGATYALVDIKYMIGELLDVMELFPTLSPIALGA